MVLACAAACVAAESFLCMDVHAQESDFEAMLKDNILTLSSRAVRERNSCHERAVFHIYAWRTTT